MHIQIHKVLRDGAERGFSCLTFNKEGDTLASVASAPDFFLTLWAWDEERISLHAKAFGQEVYNVRFSDYDPRRLTTSGTGHIRFWKMATTFTGRKLQGSIGKFGKVELSDVAAFVELPDGKVISGTETGALLLWEGNFIKCRFTRAGGELCHSSEVTSIELDRENGFIVSAGADGRICWWKFVDIDTAEVDSDNSMDFELTPVNEYNVPGSMGVKCLLNAGCLDGVQKSFFILDNNGSNSVLTVPEGVTSGIPDDVRPLVLSSNHGGGGISAMDVSPVGHIAVTVGPDGRVIFWDIKGRRQLASKRFPVAAASVSWVPLHVDPTGQSVAVGFADGVLKVLRFSKELNGDEPYMIVQMMALKPHTDAITQLSFGSSSTLLATAGKDGTVFFFECKTKFSGGQLSNWVPLRFFRLGKVEEGRAPTVCTSISWSGSCVLVGCSDGIAREIDSESVSHSTGDVETYESNMPVREIAVKIAVTTTTASSTDLNRDDAGEAVGAAGADENKDGENKGEQETTTTLVSAKISKCLYSFAHSNTEHDRYFAAMSIPMGNAQSFRECVFKEELPIRDLSLGLYSSDGKEFRKTPAVNSVRYNGSRDIILMGLSDGSVVVRPTNFVETLITTVTHNGTAGGISSVAITSDNEYVVTAGYDGLLTVSRLRYEKLLSSCSQLALDLEAGVYASQKSKQLKRKGAEPLFLEKVVSGQSLEGFGPVFEDDVDPQAVLDECIKVLPDITEAPDVAPGAYSIEDAKLKSEEDHRKTAAEVKKDKIRQIVNKLRKEFEELRYHNDQLPEVIRLGPDDMLVDTAFFSGLREEGARMIDETHKECEYIAEKALALRKKVFKRLMGDIIVEEMPLFGLRSKKPPKVMSLRTLGLNPELERALDDLHDQIRKEEESLSKAKVDAKLADDMRDRDNDGMSSVRLMNSSADSKSATKTDKKIVHNGPGRRELRAKRLAKLKKHDSEKPEENEDDPRDTEAIAHAEKTIGSFNLKSSEDYEVPEDQVINALKKRRQMMMLEESMITLRLEFNQRFLAMRALKKDIVNDIDKNNKRIAEIEKELRVSGDTGMCHPSLSAQEFPDDRDEVTTEEAEAFMQQRDKSEWKKVTPPVHSIFTGKKTVIASDPITGQLAVGAPKRVDREGVMLTSSDGNLSSAASDAAECNPEPLFPDTIITYHNSCKVSSDLLKLEHAVPSLLYARSFVNATRRPAEDSQPNNMSSEQKALASEYRRKLIFEKQFLAKSTADHIQAFDSSIEDLRLERHTLTCDLKLAELKLLTLFQEYQLLLTFEEKDNNLRVKEERCKKEKHDIQSSSGEVQGKLDQKLEEHSAWSDKMSGLIAEFKALVPDTNPYFEILTKIFKKKIKRSKGGDDIDDDEEEEEEDDDDDDDYDDEIEDTCPPGCDVGLYDHVLEYREKRLDIEEFLTDIQKSIDEMKKTKDRLKQREKQIDKDAKSTEIEIQNFQRQKQAALNKVEIYIPLRLSQLYAFTTSGVLTGPTDDEAALHALEADPDHAKDVANLRDPSKRRLTADMSLTSHTVFRNS